MTDCYTAAGVCWVHGRPVPCELAGQPASTEPLHVFSYPAQVETVELARRHTRGSRPILVHQGSPEDSIEHQAEVGKDCWCGAVLIPSG